MQKCYKCYRCPYLYNGEYCMANDDYLNENIIKELKEIEIITTGFHEETFELEEYIDE